MVSDKPIFRSAISGDDGEVDAGYLSMFWALVGWSVNNLIILAIAALLARKATDGAALVQATGVALGANAGGFAAVLGAVGLFRMGDKPRAGTATTTTTTTATAPAAAVPAIAPETVLAAARGVEPMPATIGAEDVGKRAALVGKPKRKRRAR